MRMGSPLGRLPLALCVCAFAAGDPPRLDGGDVRFDCAPRPDAPLSPGGPSGQFVHVPKAGGSTVYVFLHKFATTRSIHYGGNMTELDYKDYVYSVGHEPLGGAVADRPASTLGELLYMVALRDPLERIKSMYNYLVWANGRPFVRRGSAPADVTAAAGHFAKMETALSGEGVPKERSFEALLFRNDSYALAVAASTQYAFLLPQTCAPRCEKATWLSPCGAGAPAESARGMTVDGETVGLAAAMVNLLRADVVLTTPTLNSFLDQLTYVLGSSARSLDRLWNWKRKDQNPSSRPAQVFGDDMAARVRATPAFRREQLFYDFGARVAAARTERAVRCHAADSSHDPDCESNVPCTIGVTKAERDILGLGLGDACRVPLPTAKGGGQLSGYAT